jgi:hypothetical protein
MYVYTISLVNPVCVYITLAGGSFCPDNNTCIDFYMWLLVKSAFVQKDSRVILNLN